MLSYESKYVWKEFIESLLCEGGNESTSTFSEVINYFVELDSEDCMSKSDSCDMVLIIFRYAEYKILNHLEHVISDAMIMCKIIIYNMTVCMWE